MTTDVKILFVVSSQLSAVGCQLLAVGKDKLVELISCANISLRFASWDKGGALREIKEEHSSLISETYTPVCGPRSSVRVIGTVALIQPAP